MGCAFEQPEAGAGRERSGSSGCDRSSRARWSSTQPGGTGASPTTLDSKEQRCVMSESVLERSVLERKERDELQAIARAMGVQPAARARKADLVDLILATAGITPAVAT
ncbi:MAG: Rho termination factor N-terminal domain-containing protein, partial [Actinobacteria bacterium]|nr:Rho termination factor N-terminal domain-containing protein [Actinomycetota bacterium]